MSSSSGGANYTPTVIGHRPHCALSAVERFAEFPRQERLDSLRPYLTKYGLFPSKSDPETAPITTHELKGLVRIWKLHNIRDFWRNNTTKESLVLALHQHMQTRRKIDEIKQQARDRRQQQKHQQKRDDHHRSKMKESSFLSEDLSVVTAEASRCKSKTDLLPDVSISTEALLLDMQRASVQTYKPAHERQPSSSTTVSYQAKQDSAMIYLSRGFAVTDYRADPRKSNLQAQRQRNEESSANSAIEGDVTQLPSAKDLANPAGAVLEGSAVEQQLLVKRKCSAALLNMSTNESMQAQFIEQGGLRALFDLATSCEDDEVILDCSACLVNLIPYGDFYEPVRLLDLGVVRVLVGLMSRGRQNALVGHCCALCLCRLSAEPGIEERLIHDGALLAATKLVKFSDVTVTKIAAAKVLVNLAMTLEGNQAEKLMKNFLKCGSSLVGHHQCGRNTQKFFAEALARLACLPVARPILAKQGVVAMLKLLLTTSMMRETTDSCIAALCNMGQLHSCRKEMLAFGLIRMISNLLRTGATQTQRLCTLFLTSLSFQQDLRIPLLREGALRTIAAVISKRNDEELTRQGAYAILNFAFDPQTREDVICEDSLPALMALLNAEDESHTVDEATRTNALMALCNLLADQGTCSQVLEAGILPKLVGFTTLLGHTPGLHEYLSVAFLNLSMHAELRKRVAQTPECASLLLKLALFESTREIRSDDAAVKVVGSSTGAVKHTGTEPSRRSNFEPAYVKNALKAIFNLLMDPQSHDVFLKLNIMKSLQRLNNLSDPSPSAPTLPEPKRPGARKKVEKIVKQAAAPTDEDSVLHLSAKLVHVMTTNKDNQQVLLDAGALTLLVKITAHSPNEKTRTAVAGSLYNLTQCEQVTHEDFINALVALSHSSENVRVLWCARCFANVSTYPKGRATLGKLAKKLIPTLLAMMRSGCADAERIQYHCSVAMCNTLSVFLSKSDVLAMLREGTVQDIIVITVLRANDIQTKQVLAQALFNLLAREDTRSALIKQDVPLALLRLTTKSDSSLNLLCAKMLLNLSCEAATLAPKLLEMKVIRNMVDQCLSTSGGVKIKLLCAKALGNLSRTPAMLEGLAASTSKIVVGIRSISVVKETDALEDIASVAFHLSTADIGLECLVRQDAIPVLVSLCAGPETPGRVKQLVAATLGNLTCFSKAHKSISETKALSLLIEMMRQPINTQQTRVTACIALCNLVTHFPPSRQVAIGMDILPALRHLVWAVSTEETLSATAKTLRDLTDCTEGLPTLAGQGAMALCARLAKNEQVFLKHDVATAVCNLCAHPQAPAQLVEEGAINALFWLTLQDCLKQTRPIFRECAIATRYLAQHATLRPLICMEDNLLPLLVRLARYMECEETRYLTAVAVYYVLSNEPSQKSLCRSGAVKLLNDLSTTSPSIREVCSAALHQLPNELLSNIDGQLLSVLMSLLKITDADFTDPTRFQPDRCCASNNPWKLIPSQFSYSAKPVKAQWPTSVVGKSKSTFLAAAYEVEAYQGEQVNPSRARGANELIGTYSKMLHSCLPLKRSNLNSSVLFDEADTGIDKIGSEDSGTSTTACDSDELRRTSSDHLEVECDEKASQRQEDVQNSFEKEGDTTREHQVKTDEDGSTRTFPTISPDDNIFTSASAVSASDSLQKLSIASAFESSAQTALCTEESSEIPKVSKSGEGRAKRRTAVRRKYTLSKRRSTKKKSGGGATFESSLVAAKQQDRIADDYYELLRHCT